MAYPFEALTTLGKRVREFDGKINADRNLVRFQIGFVTEPEDRWGRAEIPYVDDDALEDGEQAPDVPDNWDDGEV